MTQLSKATLGGGCFWCVEAVFLGLKGVHSAVSGYAGGQGANPSYQQVCTGRTGHAEVVEVTFDPAEISYADVLRVFFGTHDPTTLNRQGADTGTQYRSVIFTHDAEQERVAHEVVAELTAEKIWPGKIVTEISQAPVFYKAEDYHQDYFANNPGNGYCQAVVGPKVAKFRKSFASRLKH